MITKTRIGILVILLGLAFLNPGSAYSAPTGVPTGVPTGKPKVMIVRSDGEIFEEVSKAMALEMKSSYELSEVVLKKTSTFEDFKEVFKNRAPDLLVLLENKAVDFALKYNSAQVEPAKRIKGVALLSLNLTQLLKGEKDFSGIAFEPSPFLLVTQFRYLIESPVKKVNVFYRKSFFQNKIDETARQLKGEGVVLKAYDVEKNGKSKAEVRAFLAENIPKVVKEAGPGEVLWVQLDSAVINQETFNSIWLPTVRESKLPLITSAENLVETGMHFGTFAVTPNLSDLANQAMQQVDGILKDRQSPQVYGVEEALSVNRIFNRTRAREIQLKYLENRLNDVKVLD